MTLAEDVETGLDELEKNRKGKGDEVGRSRGLLHWSFFAPQTTVESSLPQRCGCCGSSTTTNQRAESEAWNGGALNAHWSGNPAQRNCRAGSLSLGSG